jgi:hypothetical protein
MRGFTTASVAGGYMRRERALQGCVGVCGIAVCGGSYSADNVALARTCGANDNEHLCHAWDFPPAGGT